MGAFGHSDMLVCSIRGRIIRRFPISLMYLLKDTNGRSGQVIGGVRGVSNLPQASPNVVDASHAYSRGLAEKSHPYLSACGKWALKELQRLCQRAKAPPTGREWSAWYARCCALMGRYRARNDAAGRWVDALPSLFCGPQPDLARLY